MIVAKGKTLPDGTYIWTCNKCNGTGLYGIRPCNWCYGLDIDRIVMAMMAGARGQRYYALLKAFLSVQGKAMVDYANSLREPGGKMSPAGVGAVSIKFGLNFKATCEWLEETHVIRAGAYDYIMDSYYNHPDGTRKKITVAAIHDAARKRWEIDS